MQRRAANKGRWISELQIKITRLLPVRIPQTPNGFGTAAEAAGGANDGLMAMQRCTAGPGNQTDKNGGFFVIRQARHAFLTLESRFSWNYR